MLEAWKVLQKDQCTWADDVDPPVNIQPSFRVKWKAEVLRRSNDPLINTTNQQPYEDKVYTEDAYLALRS